MMDGAEDEEYSSLSIVLLLCLVHAVNLRDLLFRSKVPVNRSSNSFKPRVCLFQIKAGDGDKRPPVQHLVAYRP